MQQRLYVDGSIPRHGQVKVNAEIVSGNAERCRGKGRRVNTGALVIQMLPVDFIVILPRPQANVAKLPMPWDASIDVEPLLHDNLCGSVYGSNDLTRLHSSTVTLNAVKASRMGEKISVLRTVFPKREYLEPEALLSVPACFSLA